MEGDDDFDPVAFCDELIDLVGDRLMLAYFREEISFGAVMLFVESLEVSVLSRCVDRENHNAAADRLCDRVKAILESLHGSEGVH